MAEEYKKSTIDIDFEITKSYQIKLVQTEALRTYSLLEEEPFSYPYDERIGIDKKIFYKEDGLLATDEALTQYIINYLKTFEIVLDGIAIYEGEGDVINIEIICREDIVGSESNYGLTSRKLKTRTIASRF